jgi:hypothetical protein
MTDHIAGKANAALIRIMRRERRAGSKIARNIISWSEACELHSSPPAPEWMVEKPVEKRHHQKNRRE